MRREKERSPQNQGSGRIDLEKTCDINRECVLKEKKQESELSWIIGEDRSILGMSYFAFTLFFLFVWSSALQADFVLRVVIIKKSLKPISIENFESVLKDSSIHKIELPPIVLKEGVEVEHKQGSEMKIPKAFDEKGKVLETENTWVGESVKAKILKQEKESFPLEISILSKQYIGEIDYSSEVSLVDEKGNITATVPFVKQPVFDTMQINTKIFPQLSQWACLSSYQRQEMSSPPKPGLGLKEAMEQAPKYYSGMMVRVDSR